MAAKRSAGTELNHENWDQEEETEEAGNFTPADPEVLKGRVIKKAKRRGMASSDSSGPSLFAGFGGFKTSTTSATTSFDFLSSVNKNGSAKTSDPPKPSFSFNDPEKAITDGGGKSVPPVFAFGMGSAPREPTKTTGFSFGAVSSKSPASGFTFGEKQTGTQTFGQASKTDTTGFVEKKSAESEPPKTGFSFGSPSTKPVEKEKTDEKKEDGKDKPSLLELFKPKPGEWKCSVCDVSNNADKTACVACTTPKPGNVAEDKEKPAAKKWECPACMVFNEADKLHCVCCETAKPGSNAPPKSSSGFSAFSSGGGSGFKFSASGGGDHAGSGFKFGTSSSTASTESLGSGSGFKFGTSSTATASDHGSGFKVSESPKPCMGFQFGTSTGTTKSKDSEEQKNEPTRDKEYPPEFLSQLKSLNNDVLDWIKTHVEKNPYIYLSRVFDDYNKHVNELKTKYNIESSKSDSTNATTVPASDQGSKAESSFKFGNVTSEPSNETGSFKFGNGAASTTAPPSFTFGSGFASGPAKTGFTFGGPASSTTFGSSGNKESSSKEDQNDAEESDEPPKVEVAPVVEEDALMSVRCKLFYKKGKEFADKGLGMLHLKPVADSKKTQLLVRAETNLGNILLNVMLNKQMNFLKRNNNVQFVCVPNPPIPGIEDGPVTMLIKVKTAQLADDLDSKIKERLEDA